VLPLKAMDKLQYILVTGGAGYIGSHTAVELIKAGFIPVIADDFRNSNRVVINGLEKLIESTPIIHEVDVCDPNQMRDLFEKYSFAGIIHFAAYKAVGESVLDPLKYYYNNIQGLVNVVELALEFSVHNLVFSSSCTVYGEPNGVKVVDEDSPKSQPNSPYGFTKAIGEQILNDIFKSNPEMKIMNLRYFNPVGAHPSALIGEFPIGKPNNLLPFVTQTGIGKQKELTVFGNDYPTIDGTCVRDYIHVVDLAEAHVKAIHFLSEKQEGIIEAVNIGTGNGTSILEVINIFEKVSNSSLNWKFGPRRPGDVIEIYADASKASKLLNWQAKYTITDAVEHAWNWEQMIRNYE
jgi:UDP-glucose 4-epimerase